MFLPACSITIKGIEIVRVKRSGRPNATKLVIYYAGYNCWMCSSSFPIKVPEGPEPWHVIELLTSVIRQRDFLRPKQPSSYPARRGKQFPTQHQSSQSSNNETNPE